MSSIQENLTRLKSLIANQAKLIAVSKTRTLDEIIEAYECGQRDFGENKVQELLEKANTLKERCPEIHWHFIGRLQSNKINMLLKTPSLVSIHSIDSIKLLNKLLSKRSDKRIGVFLQTNLAQEESKAGFTAAEELKLAIDAFRADTVFFLQGLMTIGPLEVEDFKASARETFIRLFELAKEIECDKGITLELSMGMSQDFGPALAAGSNWLRIGSDIFGKRV